jgi:hypothetical protein
MPNTAVKNAEKLSPTALKKRQSKIGREARQAKIAGDKEFAKTYFEAKSKRSVDKKVAFRKKKNKK